MLPYVCVKPKVETLEDIFEIVEQNTFGDIHMIKSKLQLIK